MSVVGSTNASSHHWFLWGDVIIQLDNLVVLHSGAEIQSLPIVCSKDKHLQVPDAWSSVEISLCIKSSVFSLRISGFVHFPTLLDVGTE